MSLTTAPLSQAIDNLRIAVDGVQAQASALVEQTEAMIEQTDLIERIKLPGIAFDPSELPGLSAAEALFDDIDAFPEKMLETQGEVLAKIALFDETVGEIATFDEACIEMLGERKAALSGLREQLEGLEEQIVEDMKRLMEEAGEKLEETFTDGMQEAGRATFDEVETLLKDAFSEYGTIADDTASLLESTTDDVLKNFENGGKEIFEDVIEDRVRQLVEAQLVEVIEDLGLSQAISTSSATLYQSIASAAPNLVVALKAVSAVKSILEAMKL